MRHVQISLVLDKDLVLWCAGRAEMWISRAAGKQA